MFCCSSSVTSKPPVCRLVGCATPDGTEFSLSGGSVWGILRLQPGVVCMVIGSSVLCASLMVNVSHWSHQSRVYFICVAHTVLEQIV